MLIKEAEGKNIFRWLIETNYKPSNEQLSSEKIQARKLIEKRVDTEWTRKDIEFLLDKGYTLTFCKRWYNHFRDYYKIRKDEYTYSSEWNWKILSEEKLDYILEQRDDFALELCSKNGRNIF